MDQQPENEKDSNGIQFLYSSIATFIFYSGIVILSATYTEYVLVHAFNDGFSSCSTQSWWMTWLSNNLLKRIPIEYSDIILWIYAKYVPQFFGIALIGGFFSNLIWKSWKNKILLTVHSSCLIILFSFSIILCSSSIILLSGFISKNTEYTNIIKNYEKNEAPIEPGASWQHGIIWGFEVNSSKDINTIHTKISQYNIRNIFIPGLLVQRLNKNGPTLWNKYIEMLRTAKKEYHVKIYVDMEAYFFDQVGVEFPPQAVLSMAFSPEEVYLISRQYGKALKEHLLVDFILGPVLDRKISPRDSLIESRSFSNNYEKIYIYASAMIAGFHDAGIACIAKHFPGHPQVEVAPNNSHSKSFSFYSEQEINNSSDIYRKLYNKEQIKLRAILPDPVIIPAINNERPFTISRNGVSEFLNNEAVYGVDKLRNTLVVSDAVTMVMGKYNDARKNESFDENTKFIQDMCDSTIDLFNAGHDLVLTQEIEPEKIDEFNLCLGKRQIDITEKQNSGDVKASKILTRVQNSIVQWAAAIPDDPELFNRGYALRLSSERLTHTNNMASARRPKSILFLSTCYRRDDVYAAVKKIFSTSEIDSVVYKKINDSFEIFLPSKGDKKVSTSKIIPDHYTDNLIATIRDYDLVILSFDNYKNYLNVTKNYIAALIKEAEKLGNHDSELANKILIVCATHPEFYYEEATRIDFLKALNRFPTYAVFRNTNNLWNSMEQIVCDMSGDKTRWEFCINKTINQVSNYELNIPDYYYVNRLSQRDLFTCDKKYPTLYRRFLGTLGCNMREIQEHTNLLGVALLILSTLTLLLYISHIFSNFFYRKRN